MSYRVLLAAVIAAAMSGVAVGERADRAAVTVAAGEQGVAARTASGMVVDEPDRAGTGLPAADLQLRQLPPGRPRLAMRTQPAPQVAAAEPAQAAADGPATTAFSALPTSTRDLAERLTFRLRAGVALDSAPASGDALRGGAPLPPGFVESRSWLVGDAMVGARDILLPSLGGYFLSSFALDTGDTLASRSALVAPGDATDQRIAIKAGYVEWGNDARRPQPLWLRGGRQFRLDGGALFAYFDGVTVGYRTRGLEASAFGGRRVVLYVDSEAGLTFGATAAIDLGALRGTPVRIALDYMGLAIDQRVATADGTGDDATQLRQLISVTGSYEPSRLVRAELRARIVDAGEITAGGAASETGLGLGRIAARVRLSPTGSVMVIGDIEQRMGGDLAYDLAAPSAVDVVDVSRRLGVGLGAPIDALTVGARVDVRGKASELLVFGRAQLPQGTPEAVHHQGWFEGGAAIAGQAFGVAWLTAQYTGRQYAREAAASEMASAFADTAGAGLDRLHELSLDTTLRSSGRGGMRWRAGLGGFYRIYDLVTPYRTARNDGRGGGRVELQWWFTRTLHVEAAAEIAQPSPILAREIGAMSAIRGALEARW